MLSHEEFKQEELTRPDVEAEYAALTEEFELFNELLLARRRAGLTQGEVAERMGTKTPAVARLEAGGGSNRHSPSLRTLRRYAQAVGCELQVRLVPR